MIYAETWHLILAGRKRRTSRKQYAGETTECVGGQIVCVRDRLGRPRWIVGHTYAVQPERCAFALAHWKLLRIESVEHPLEISLEDARAEGFDSVEAFQRTWRKLHGAHADEPVWALTFGPPELTEPGKALMQRAIKMCDQEAA